MKGPLTSVIIPVYDSERFLADAIESVQAQDYEPIEIVVVDDGSRDGSADVARSFAGVTCLRQPNQGPSAARNAGLAVSRGEFIAFLDADDVMEPRMISTQVSYLLEHAECGCVLGRQTIFLEPGARRPDWLIGDRVHGEEAGVPFMCVVVRREVVDRVGGFDPELRFAEDQDFVFRIRRAGFVIEVRPDVIIRRRVHDANLTHQTRNLRSGLLRSVRHLVEAQRDEERGPSSC